MDYSGEKVLITGANSGLGLAVAKRFAGLGADTILVCRTKEGGERAALEIEAETPNASIRLMTCDLASMASIDQLITDVKAEDSTLDLLFNNAATMKRDRTITEDGFEMMFQVNYLAPFIIMNSLLGLLRSSSTHLLLGNGRPSAKLRLDFDDLQFEKHYRMYDSFFRTKLCLLLASVELAHRPEGQGVSIHMADPGPFKSGLIREVPWPAGWIKNLFSGTLDEAADNILYVADSKMARTGTGKVFKKRQEVPLTSYWKDTKVRDQLWSATEAMIEQT